MELTAAVVAVRISRIIVKELEYPTDNVFFWTDSQSVLKYIANETTRFQTFVTNRVTVIREASSVQQWNYVDTKSNPADSASRGLVMHRFLRGRSWFEGPQFLWKSERKWPNIDGITKEIPSDDPEVKKTVSFAVASQPSQGMNRLLEYFSDWNKLKRTVAWMLKAMENLKKWANVQKELKQNRDSIICPTDERIMEMQMLNIKTKHLHSSKGKTGSELLRPDTLEDAEKVLVRYVQHQHFPDELKILENRHRGKVSAKKTLSRTLNKLDPFLEAGLLRVGGRLDRAPTPHNAKHPVLLPKDSVISRLIIHDCHKRVGHQGKNSMLALLRQKYWILGANIIIKRLMSKWVTCRKYRAHGGEQKMADLPIERLQPDEPPFTRVGIDFFGHIEVKRGRVVVKRYGVIFTCLAIRAVHLEVAFSMDTDSCINAMRRFIARRGTVEFIRTDNGSNFIASERELKDEITKWNQSKIHNALLQQNVTWKFNPPTGSHFGGVWERMIRSVRKILHSLLKEQVIRLDDETLQTLFCEIEAIINGRPITELSDDPRSPNTEPYCILEQERAFHPVSFTELTTIQDDAGDRYSTWQMFFGRDGSKNTFHYFSHVRSGSIRVGTFQ